MRFQSTTRQDYALWRHPHPYAAFPEGEAYRTWNPPMQNMYAVPPAMNPTGYYVPHQFVSPYMRVYPAPAYVGPPAHLGRKDMRMMGSANRRMVPEPPPFQHPYPHVSHTVTPGLASYVQRVPWGAGDPWTSAPGMISEDDLDLLHGDDEDLFGEDDDWGDEDDDWGDDDWGDDDWLGAKEKKKKLRPFKAMSALFTKKKDTGKSKAEEMAEQLVQIQKQIAPAAPERRARREARRELRELPVVVPTPEPAAPTVNWKAAAAVGVGSVVLLGVGLWAGKRFLA